MPRATPHLRHGALLAAGVAALALGACGSDDAPTATTTAAAQTTTAPAAPGRYTAAEVAKLAKMRRAAGDAGWVSLTGCRVTRILTTHAEVLRYRTNADAPVVTNPADDIGVVFAPAPQCREALTANLTLVR